MLQQTCQIYVNYFKSENNKIKAAFIKVGLIFNKLQNFTFSLFLVEFFAVISSTIDKQLFFENVQQQKISILKINDKQNCFNFVATFSPN